MSHREDIIANFLADTYAGNVEQERSALLGYEAYKEERSIMDANFIIGDAFYRKYAARYLNPMPVFCMLRNYEEYRAKQLIALN